jgi:hypothetical protein
LVKSLNRLPRSLVRCAEKYAEEADLEKHKLIDLASANYTGMFLERLKQGTPQQEKPTTCNLIMGPYGQSNDGRAWDDLALSGFGQNPITKITYSNTSTALESLQVVYGSTPGPLYGTKGNVTTDVTFSAGESVSRAIVFFNEKEVHGLVLTTDAGRNITLGVADTEDPNVAWATPCPGDTAQAGKYRLISFGGTADKVVISLTLVWTPKK